MRRAVLRDHPRAVGTVLLELVLLVLVVVAGFSQRAVSGAPIVMRVDPPAVGTCLRQTTDGAQATPCTQPHGLQLTRSWPVWLWDGRGVNRGAAIEMCRLAATKFLGSAARFQDWGPIPLSTMSVVTGGPGLDDQPWGWQACAITPRPGVGYPVAKADLTGSLSGATAMSSRPAQLRSCFDVVERGWTPASCSGIHSGEFLAERPVSITGGRLSARSHNELLASCRIAAPWLIGRALTGDDRVHITMRNSGIGSGDTAPVTPPAGSSTFPQLITMRCAIEGIEGHHLSGSVIGLGNRPLPLG